MKQDTLTYTSRIDELAGACRVLADNLDAAANGLRDDGRGIRSDILERALSLGTAISALCSDMLRHAVDLEIPDLLAIPGESLADARALLECIIAFEDGIERVRAAALAALDGVLALETADQQLFGLLTECQAQASGLRGELLAVAPPMQHPAARDLARGQHVFNAIITLATEATELDTMTVSTLCSLVDERFNHTLTIALMLKRIVIGSGRVTSAPPLPTIPAIARPSAADSADDVAHAPQAAAKQPDQAPTEPVDAVSVDVSTHATTASEAPAMVTAFLPEERPEPEIPTPEEPPAVRVPDEPAPTQPIPPLVEQAQPSAKDEVLAAGDLSLTTEPQTAEDLALDRVDLGGPDDEPIVLEPIFTTAHEISESRDAHPSRIMAQQLLELDPQERIAALPDLVIQLLSEDRGALAYHIAHAYDQARPDVIERIPSWLVRALLLTPYVRTANSEMAIELTECFIAYDADEIALSPEPWSAALSLLVMAILPAALIAPKTGLPSLLQLLPEEGMPARCHEFCQTIITFAMEAQPLDPQVIRLLENQFSWEQELVALRAEAETYWAEYERKELVYDPATDVWQNWTSPGRFIHRMITPIRMDNAGQLHDALEAADHLRTPQNVKREMEHTDRQVIGRQIGPDIRERALVHLRNYTHDAINFVRRWAKLIEYRPSADQRVLSEQIGHLRDQVLALQAPVMAELDMMEQSVSPVVQCAVVFARRAVSRIIALLVGQDSSSSMVPSFILMNWPLLRTADIVLDDQWQPQAGASLSIPTLLRIIADFDGTWQPLLDMHHNADDHEATRRIIDYLMAVEPGSERAGALHERQEQQLMHLRAELHTNLKQARCTIDNIITYGLLRENEIQQTTADVLSLSAKIDHQQRLGDIRKRIRQLTNQFQRRHDTQIAQVRGYLSRSKIAPDNSAYERIEQALNEGDPLTANEYISLAERGDQLPQAASWGETFERFIRRDMRKLAEFLQAENPQNMIQKLKRATTEASVCQFGPIAIQGGAHAADALHLLESWFEAKRLMSRNPPRDGWDITQIGPVVSQVFDQLGFITTSVDLLNRPSRRLWLSITTQPLKDKDICPTPRYGSEAAGRYRLLIIHDRATEDDIIQEIADTQKGQPPIIICYFGHMTRPRRRALTRLCHQKYRTCILIDDTLAVFLSAYRSPRLRQVFECTLPFTYLNPYVTTAGIVSPEMFYGRQRERDEVLDPMGSCFIFGGRQIGKTALLRHVENIAHNPEHGQIIRLIDMKDKGIGLDRPIEAIWECIVAELQPFGVLPKSLPANTGVERYQEHIENWLNEDKDRQIIMLLDEADQFLISDGNSSAKTRDGGTGNFRHTSRLKGLMDRTRRRFKVVFAGLHNVQRTTRQENNPLAHYGMPLCIGPLFENNEWREARALIERPMSSLGYRFKTTDIVTRILSQTNYYPSLLQLYGVEMIRYLSDPNKPLFPADQNPPHMIIARYIEEIYQRRDLRDNIRQRFRLTLELDRRYEVLTYVVTDSALQDEQILLNGLSVAEIREQALRWWAAGFADDSSDGMILSLLEELVGLGIFRRFSGNRFTLRNANMLLLVGTQDEIRAELGREREVSPPYNADVFRSAFTLDSHKNGDSVVRRSPLTAQQTSDLRNSGHGVSIIFGVKADGLSDLAPYLRQSFGPSQVIVLPPDASEAVYNQQLQALNQRNLNGVTLLLVPPSMGWRLTWADRAQQRLADLTSRTAFARVVFIADARHTWELLTHEADALDRAFASDIRSITLQPWQDAALHQWFLDCDISPSERKARTQVTNVTGNWPSLLYRYYERVHMNLPAWQDVLDSMVIEQQTAAKVAEIADELGLMIAEPVQALSVLAELYGTKPVPSEDVVEMLDGDLSAPVIHRSLRWATLLSLITPAGPHQWKMSPLIQRVLYNLKRGSE